MLAAAYQAGITAYGYYAAGGRAIVQDVKGENEHNVTFVTPSTSGCRVTTSRDSRGLYSAF